MSRVKFEDVDTYLHKVSPASTSVLKEMEARAARHDFPIVGPLVGRFLYQMAKVSNAGKILELGSGYGYSAFWFSRALGNKGQITLTDLEEDNRELAYEYFKRGRLKSRFTFHVGDALVIARKLTGTYDIIFNDIEKEDYPMTINVAAKLLRPGGLFITDNIIWDGLVFDPAARDRGTRGIRKFTRQLYGDSRFFTTVIPLRDGLTLAVKK